MSDSAAVPAREAEIRARVAAYETHALPFYFGDAAKDVPWLLAALSEARQELAEAKQSADNFYHQDVTHLRMLKEAQARLTATEEALREYGRHAEWCPSHRYNNRPCTCGFTAALAVPATAKEPT